MSRFHLLDDLLRSLLKRRLTDGEVYVKRGRSRRVERTPRGETATSSQERAWAVRAGHRKGSFFQAGTGELPPGPWPEPAGRPLQLPEPVAGGAWTTPADLESPILGEREGFKLLESLGRELESELPGARLLRAVLEDGSSEAELASSRGIKASFRQRVSTLYLEVAGPGENAPGASLYLAAREPHQFQPTSLARRLADRLAVCASGAAPERDGGELLLAPPVAIRLLAGLLPVLVGPAPESHLLSVRGRWGSDPVTVIDDGRFAGGVLEAAQDGEGVATRAVTLIEKGVFRQPLLAWSQEGLAPGSPSGCMRRPSWRDLPSPGPTHLYVAPEPSHSVAALLGSVERGYYLIDATGPGRFDLAADRFALPVCGFAVRSGQASAPVAGAWLCGGLGSLLRGVTGVGRDLTFQPLDGMIGAPTLLVRGLELRKSLG